MRSPPIDLYLDHDADPEISLDVFFLSKVFEKAAWAKREWNKWIVNK
jgi:hypothetical protein